MKARHELYTPWREPVESLRRRHVGRERLLTRLRQGIIALQRGTPVGLYLFGPRGSGKSHLLALVRDEFAAAGARVTWISEDIPAIASAADLLERAAQPEVPRWLGRARPPRELTPRIEVLIVEGLDKRLVELGSGGEAHRERASLRANWDGRRDLWLIGTGVELCSPLTSPDEPFYGWFDAEPVEPLAPPDDQRLLDALVSEETRSGLRWSARRQALVALAGGSPRVLVSLAECAAADGVADASDALLSVVDRFTPHYQVRFRDLSRQGQRITEVLANARAELNPTQIAEQLSSSPQTAATQARRLAEEGVLGRREDGGLTWYRIAEPVFRYWFEYRNAQWEHTRVSIAGRLLEALFTADDLVEAWWLSAERDPIAPLATAVRGAKVRGKLLGRALSEIQLVGTGSGRSEAIRALFEKMVGAELGVEFFLRVPHDAEVIALAAVILPGPPQLVETLRFDLALRSGAEKPRPLFRRWLEAVATDTTPGAPWATIDRLLFRALDRTIGPGQPWKLTLVEQGRAARLPFVRSHLLVRGKLASHGPVLGAAAVGSHVRSTDHDLGDLLGAAVQIGADDLAETALRAWAPFSVSGLPETPVPGRACPRCPELLVRWAVQPLRRSTTDYARQHYVRIALTWARTLGRVDDDTFDFAAIAILRAAPYASESLMQDAPVRVALVGLGVDRPDRLERLAELGEVVGRAMAIAQQLLPTDGARLHPELERLRDLLAGFNATAR